MLKDFYAEILRAAGMEDVDVYAVMNKLIEENAGLNGLQVDTRFAGTRKQPDVCGSISGINVNNFTPANLAYGFWEGMMEELHIMYKQMGEKRINLVGSGNGIRKNAHLVKIAEGKFGGKLKVPAHMEEAAYGAALFGMVACGAFDSAERAQALVRYEGVKLI